MNYGNPNCEVCHGEGGSYYNGRWRRCNCTRQTEAQRRMQERINTPPGVRRLTMADLLRSHERRGRNPTNG